MIANREDTQRQACRVAAPATQEVSHTSAFPGAPLPSLGGMEYAVGNDGAPGAAKNTGGGALATASVHTLFEN